MNHVHCRINKVLRAEGISQLTLADRLGYGESQSYVSRLACGRVVPTIITALKVADALSELTGRAIPLDDLWSLEDEAQEVDSRQGRPLLALAGRRFGSLVVIRREATNKRTGHAMWLVRCDCGREKLVRGTSMMRGDSRTCGARSCIEQMRVAA